MRMRTIRVPMCLRPASKPPRGEANRITGGAGKEVLEMQLVDPAHPRQVLRRDLAGRVVRARTGQPEEGALMRDREPLWSIIVLRSASPPG